LAYHFSEIYENKNDLAKFLSKKIILNLIDVTAYFEKMYLLQIIFANSLLMNTFQRCLVTIKKNIFFVNFLFYQKKTTQTPFFCIFPKSYVKCTFIFSHLYESN